MLDNPFLFDLIKSETFDWDKNDVMYSYGPNSVNNPILGFLSGYLSEYVRVSINILNKPWFNNPSQNNELDIVYLPGRMNTEYLQKLLLQKE